MGNKKIDRFNDPTSKYYKYNAVKKDNALTFTKCFYYIGLGLFFIFLAYSVLSTNWENISNNGVEISENLLNSIKCEINYKGFDYSGPCLEREEIFNFINNSVEVVKCE